MKPDTLLKIEGVLRELRVESPLNDGALSNMTIAIGELASALVDKRARTTAKNALLLAALAIRIAEEGDATFPANSPDPEPSTITV